MKKLFAIMLGITSAVSLSSCAPAGGEGSNNGSSMWVMLVLYAVIIAAVYLLMIRPNSKKKKQEQALRDNLEIGDEITTIGGITGRVVSIKDDSDTFILETGADRTKMQLKKWAISTNDTAQAKAEAKKAEAAAAKNKGKAEKSGKENKSGKEKK